LENGLKIMIVDDEEEICSILKGSCQSSGHRAETFTDPVKALDAMKKEQPEVLISDIKMPGMDGLELVRKAKGINAGIYSVLVTGYASMESAIEALRQDVDDYITKPFDLVEVEKIIERLAEKKHIEWEKEILVEELKKKNEKLEKAKELLSARVRDARGNLARINFDLEKKLEELGVINGVGRVINSVLDTEKLFNLCLRLVSRKMGVESSSIMIYDKLQNHLVVKASQGAKGRFAGAVERVGDGVAGWVAMHKRPLLVKDISRDYRFSHDKIRRYRSKSFISVPLMQKKELIGVLNVSDKVGGEAFCGDDVNLLVTLASQISVAIENARLYRTVQENCLRTIRALVVSLEAKDKYTSGHSVRVSGYAIKIAKRMNIDGTDLSNLYYAAQLHDIGKIGVDEKILQKPTRLNEEEFAAIKQHPVIGEKIIGSLEFLKDVRGIIRGHHEAVDGSGYPDGLKGKDIPRAARILRVADAYDAMTSERPYRKAMSSDKAMREIVAHTGKDFAPEIVEVFKELVYEGSASVVRPYENMFIEKHLALA